VSPILLDTNAYVAFKRGHAEAVSILQHAPVIVMTPVVLGELRGGFAAGSRERENRAELAALLATPRVTTVPVDADTADHYAALYASLRRAGTPIPSNDMWIAASAIQHDLCLFSYDRHFRLVPGLKVGRSAADFAMP
jgi:predicted nucleic acid-binding protein